MADHYYDDYDNTIAADDDYLWGKSASPAGSGAGLTSEEIDEYDLEVEQEDEEALQAFREDQGLDNNCYLAQSHAFATHTGPIVGSATIQHFNVFGYQFTSHKPPVYDGTDLTGWEKAVKYWMDNSTLQEKNKVPTIVQNLSGLATRWIEELNQDMLLLQSSSGLDHII